MSFADLIARADRIAMNAFGDKDANGEPVPVTYGPQVGAPVSTTPTGAPLTGLFDEPYVLVKGSAEAGVEALGPSVFLRLEDLPTNPEDDEPTLTIRGVDYSVHGREPDGAGGIVLRLRRKS